MDLGLASLDPTTVIAGALVCFLAAALGGVAGMGSGMILTLFITPIIGAKAVIPVISVLMVINNASRVWFYRDALVPSRIGMIAGVAIPMSYLGAQIYVRLDGAIIQAMLGGILIASIPLRRWMAGREILSSLIVGAGMLVIPMLMGFGLVGPALLATDAAIAVLVNLAKVAFFGSLDALSMPLFLLALAMGLFTIPGTWAGAWIVRKTSVRVHTIFIEALILLGGVSLVWGGLLA